LREKKKKQKAKKPGKRWKKRGELQGAGDLQKKVWREGEVTDICRKSYLPSIGLKRKAILCIKWVRGKRGGGRERN